MVFQAIFAGIATAVKFIFTGQSLLASALRFIGGSILSQLLAGQTKVEGPRLSDLKVQVSTYGNPIPRLYGEAVRIAGNVIDKSDLIERKKKKKKKMLGITVASQTTYTYFVHLAVALAEGELPPNALRKVYANGKVIFDRDAAVAQPTTPTGTPWGGSLTLGRLGLFFQRKETKTQGVFKNLTFYPGSATQDVDPLLQSLHPGEDVPAYRHTAYVVIEELALADYGNGVPNLEFEVETSHKSLRQTVEHIAAFADVTVNAWQLARDLRGYVVAKAGSVWSAIEPLAGAFSFDLISDGADFRAVKRGRHMRTILEEGDFAARPAGEARAKDPTRAKREDPNTYPDEVTVTFFDASREYQPNTMRAFRNEGFAKNKVDVELAIVFDDATEPRNIAQRTLDESIASANALDLEVSAKLRWLEAGDLVGIPIDGEVQPFRLSNRIESPNGVVSFNAVFEDVLAYDPDAIPGTSGTLPTNTLALPGDTIFQPIDAPIIEDADDDPGFYFAAAGTGAGWVGADIERAEGVGSPLSYDLITDTVVDATIAECATTLASGPTAYIDWTNTLEIVVLGGDEPESATEEDVLVRNANFAWVGPTNGQGGEYINFITATPGGSPNTYTLSGLLRGRRGTEHRVGSHGAGERFVLMNTSEVNRMDFGPADWNLDRTYRATSINQDDVDGLTTVFANSGEGKRPLAPVHLRGERNDANNDVLLSWTRRSRYQSPVLGGGPVPVGEPNEAYQLDLYNTAGTAIVRTVTITNESEYNYTTADQTTDGKTPGAAVRMDVYQLSDVRGLGQVAQGTV